MNGTMVVRRIDSGRCSDVEPPLDPNWDDLTKLRWHAAVVTLDTGLAVEVHHFPTNYCIVVKGSSSTANDFHDAWTLLNGIALGARAISKATAGGQP